MWPLLCIIVHIDTGHAGIQYKKTIKTWTIKGHEIYKVFQSGQEKENKEILKIGRQRKVPTSIGIHSNRLS